MALPDTDRVWRRALAAFQLAGVLASGWYVWTRDIVPRLGLSSWPDIMAQAFFYVLLAWICGALTTFWIYYVLSLAEFPAAAGFSLRNSTPAMWIAPAIVLISTDWPAAFVVGLVLIGAATSQLIARWGGIEPAAPAVAFGKPAIGAKPIFSAPWPDSAFSSSSSPVLLAALTAQAAAVEFLWRRPFGAAALLALSTAILISLAISTGAYRPEKSKPLPHAGWSIVVSFLLAATLTFGGIAVRGRGFGGSSDRPGTGQTAAAPTKGPESLAAFDDLAFGGDFPGVILLPELKPYATVFIPAPLLPAPAGTIARTAAGIPFTGEYWLFRWPASRPPRRSIVRRGSTADLSFHTTDGMPLEMEAHQKLATPLSMQCCRQIQVEIHRADEFAARVALEMVLLDSHQPVSLGQTLGRAFCDRGVVSFDVPAHAAIAQFDEIKVIFRRTGRADRSARIAIERFNLLP